jgi:hypothetical protein
VIERLDPNEFRQPVQIGAISHVIDSPRFSGLFPQAVFGVAVT